MKEQSLPAMASMDSFSVLIEESLRNELRKAEELEEKLSEQEASFHKLKDFEQEKISMKESKTQIKSLLEILQNWNSSSSKDWFQTFMADERIRRLESELESTKEKLSRAEKNEQASSLKAKTLAEEASNLKQELKCLTDAEENNKKAMDDLALALKEVITEATEAKNKLSSTQIELEKTKGYVENLKMKLRKLQGKYRESKKEADRYKNTSERLRIEAEESLLAWNTREVGFVECVRKAESERNAAQEECQSLFESLQDAENMKKKAKEENHKLRDIMKQAINEANVAKEAATIARAENSQLKDAIAKKDEALDFLSQENETLKINEAAAHYIIEELKMFCESSNGNNKGV